MKRYTDWADIHRNISLLSPQPQPDHSLASFKSQSHMHFTFLTKIFSSIFEIQPNLWSHDLSDHVIFNHTHQKIEVTFSFLEFVPACEKSLYSVYSLLRYFNLRVLWQEWLHPIFGNYTEIFKSTYNFMNLYQQTKNQAISSICSRDIVALKILQFDWTTAFLPISQKSDFFQI